MALRTLTAVVLAAGALGAGACGAGDVDVDALRDGANQALEDVRSGGQAGLDEARKQLRRVQDELEQSDLPDDARRQLEKTRDQLREALR